ncbi:MAG TPA: hypothetical protein VF008_04580 [Niastella sp.]
MKSKLRFSLLLLPFVLPILFVACNKADHSDTADDPAEPFSNTNTFTTTTTTLCPNAPNYGDSIIYLQPVNGQYTVPPVNNIGIKGTYVSWPEGLDINSNTGVINVSKSETGVRYKIGFVKNGATDTCISELIIGGMTYLDNIFVMDRNDTLALPVFNANPNNTSICDMSDDSDYPDNNGNGNNKCAFDDDVPGQKANDQKLRVRTKSGIINLKKSLADGLFGNNPKNGDSKKIKINYRLNDDSKKSTQKITVQVMYYDKVSSIPIALQQEVAGKRTSMTSYQIVNGKPRPPLLIIAGLSY